MGFAKRFEELEIWKESIEICRLIFEITSSTDWKNDFGLKDQVRRCSISISSNIAEGFEYNTSKEFIRFIKYAKGSAGELRSQLIVLEKSGLISGRNHDILHPRIEKLSRQIMAFINSLRS